MPLWVDSHEVVLTIKRVRGTNPVSAGRATRSAGAKSPRSPTQGDRPQTANLSTELSCVIVTPGPVRSVGAFLPGIQVAAGPSLLQHRLILSRPSG